MKAKYLGDSYDIVKQSLLRWLSPLGAWATHPMFTEPVVPDVASSFARLLGCRLLSQDVLTKASNRGVFLSPARTCEENVFLDPDTGLRLQSVKGAKAPEYLFGHELVEIATAKPNRLILLFDQALARGAQSNQLRAKLMSLADEGITGFAYVSHACFLLVGRDESSVENAYHTIIRESRLPESRFVHPNSSVIARDL